MELVILITVIILALLPLFIFEVQRKKAFEKALQKDIEAYTSYWFVVGCHPNGLCSMFIGIKGFAFDAISAKKELQAAVQIEEIIIINFKEVTHKEYELANEKAIR